MENPDPLGVKIWVTFLQGTSNIGGSGCRLGNRVSYWKKESKLFMVIYEKDEHSG